MKIFLSVGAGSEDGVCRGDWATREGGGTEARGDDGTEQDKLTWLPNGGLDPGRSQPCNIHVASALRTRALAATVAHKYQCRRRAGRTRHKVSILRLLQIARALNEYSRDSRTLNQLGRATAGAPKSRFRFPQGTCDGHARLCQFSGHRYGGARQINSSVLTPTHVGLRVRCIRQLRIVYQLAFLYLIAAPWPASSRTRAAHSSGPPTPPDARRSSPRACVVLLARRRSHPLQRDRGYKYHWVPVRPEHFRCPRRVSLVCLSGVLPCDRDLCAAPAHYYRPSVCKSSISITLWIHLTLSPQRKVYPLELTDPRHIPQVRFVVTVHHQQNSPSVSQNDTKDPHPLPNRASNGLLLTHAITQVLSIANNSIFGDNCAKCQAGLEVGKFLAMAAPQEGPALAVALCHHFNFNSDCDTMFGILGLGSVVTQVIANADVGGFDGQVRFSHSSWKGYRHTCESRCSARIFLGCVRYRRSHH